MAGLFVHRHLEVAWGCLNGEVEDLESTFFHMYFTEDIFD